MLQQPIIRLLLGLVLCFACGFTVVSAQETEEAPAETSEGGVGQYAPVNGLEMYYEIHGSGGQPIILLHGGLGGTVDFAQLLPLLSQTRQVIAVELQGHGHTADIDRPFSMETMADDVAALIDTLELGQVDLLGFSLGGGVALRTAIQYPEKVHKLVLLSTPMRRAGWHDEVLAGMSAMNAEAAAMMLETPMYQFYASVAPNIDDWAALIQKSGDLQRTDYDWSAEFAELQMPVLLVVGDSDSVRLDHAVEMFELLGGNIAGDFGTLPASQLIVLPGTGHYFTLFRVDLLASVIPPFLDAPMPETMPDAMPETMPDAMPDATPETTPEA
jgi:pimeloyl-ACP methyl ester carboxylesterase